MCVINPTEALYISITRTLVITMAITRQKKETVVKKLKDIVTNAKTIVFVHFSNVSGEEYENIRTVCEQENVGYMVAKKTLIKKAFEGNTVAGEMPALEGEIAVVYGEDITAPARVINEQAKNTKESYSLSVEYLIMNLFLNRRYKKLQTSRQQRHSTHNSLQLFAHQ